MPAGLPVAPKHLHLDRFEVSRRSPAFPELHRLDVGGCACTKTKEPAAKRSSNSAVLGTGLK